MRLQYEVSVRARIRILKRTYSINEQKIKIFNCVLFSARWFMQIVAMWSFSTLNGTNCTKFSIRSKAKQIISISFWYHTTSNGLAQYANTLVSSISMASSGWKRIVIKFIYISPNKSVRRWFTHSTLFAIVHRNDIIQCTRVPFNQFANFAIKTTRFSPL